VFSAPVSEGGKLAQTARVTISCNGVLVRLSQIMHGQATQSVESQPV
jgi:hypothetical protein